MIRKLCESETLVPRASRKLPKPTICQPTGVFFWINRATPNLCWLILVGRMREETGFKTYLWLFGYSIMPCLGSPCTFLGLQSPQSPGHLLSLQDFLLHALLENFLHITSKSVKSQGILPSGCRMSFIRIFCIEKAILFQNYM